MKQVNSNHGVPTSLLGKHLDNCKPKIVVIKKYVKSIKCAWARFRILACYIFCTYRIIQLTEHSFLLSFIGIFGTRPSLTLFFAYKTPVRWNSCNIITMLTHLGNCFVNNKKRKVLSTFTPSTHTRLWLEERKKVVTNTHPTV